MPNMFEQLVSMMMGGGNPMGVLQQMAGQNPQIGMAVQMLQGKNPKQIEQMAMNMAKKQGVDANVLRQQIAQRFGIK